ncbi:CLAVATA3/ESR (CLE)-related protein 25 [Zea mays]|uniref:CLAVATA3/ESR (CLE)-related protein 25 n=1 Tax=Zea mays TaxID=4577 RepID=UPI0007E5697C|nr:CLAVATA3/ESR (CLE)-related protein 25 [Zea mays]|eukprot:NP_001315296.1 CLAVATA3/ESR (CLE)-related protein 25 [Zea mays]
MIPSRTAREGCPMALILSTTEEPASQDDRRDEHDVGSAHAEAWKLPNPKRPAIATCWERRLANRRCVALHTCIAWRKRNRQEVHRGVVGLAGMLGVTRGRWPALSSSKHCYLRRF